MVKCNKDQVTRLQRALKREKNPTMRQRIQMVLLRENGMTQPAIAEAMGVSLSTVNRAHMAYDHGGLKALKSKPSGGRKRENMTLAEEKALLARFAKVAGPGDLGKAREQGLFLGQRHVFALASAAGLGFERLEPTVVIGHVRPVHRAQRHAHRFRNRRLRHP